MLYTLQRSIILYALTATLLNPIASAGEYHITEFDSAKVIATVEFQTEAIFTLNDIVYRLERVKESATLAKSKEIMIPKIEFGTDNLAYTLASIRTTLLEIEKADNHWNLLIMGNEAFQDQQIEAVTHSKATLHQVLLQLARQTGSRIRFDDDSISFIQKNNPNELPEIVIPIGDDMMFEIHKKVYQLKPTNPTKTRLTARNYPARTVSDGMPLGELCEFFDHLLQNDTPKKGLRKARCMADPRVEDLRCGYFSVSNMSMERAIILLAEHTNTKAVFEDAIIRFVPKTG